MDRPISSVSHKIKKRQIFFVLIFLFCTVVFARQNQVDEGKKLKEEIKAVYESGGEGGLRNFVRSKTGIIKNKFIVDIAKRGVKERNEKWLKISEIVAEEKKDEKTLADVYSEMGEYLRLISDNKKAIGYLEKALPIYIKIGDIDGQGYVLYKMGVIYFYIGDNSRALQMYDKALLFFEKTGDIVNQGNSLWRKGMVYFYTGNNPMARDMYGKALLLFEKSGDITGQGNVLWGQGDIYFYTGNNERALEVYDKALPFFEKAGDYLGQGNVLKSKGDIYLYRGDNSKALEMYDKALPLLKEEASFSGQANVYLSKGYLYLNIGENAAAFEMCEKALAFYEKSENPWGKGNVYFVKAEIYHKTGDNSNALKIYDKALKFYEMAGYLLGQGNVYQSKGYIYFEMGDHFNALEMDDKALSFFEKVGDPRGQGNVYFSKGDVYSKKAQYSKSLEMYEKALPFYEKAASPLGQGNVYRSKGEIYFLTGDNSKAIEMYDTAIQFYTKIGDIESGSFILYQKAKVLVKQNKKDEALPLFQKSISNLEKIRTLTVFSGMKQTFMRKVYDQYEETAVFMLENNYYERGFKYAESLKSRVFLDLIAEGLVKVDKGILPDLRQKRDNLVSTLSAISKEISTTAGKHDEKRLKQLKDKYRKVEGEFEALLVKIKLKNPLYASVGYSEPVSVQDLQEKVLKKDELLLRYFISTDNFYVFVVSREDFKLVTLKDTAKDVNEIVELYLISVEENNPRRMKEYGKALYKKLFKPLETWIKNRREIIIVPDGQLATIPFESFVIDDKGSHQPVYLLEKYRVKYIQSASVLSILREHYQRESTSKSFVGFGDPVYDYESFKQGKPEKGSFTRSLEKSDEISQIHRGRYQREGGILNRLKGSGEEVNAIAELFKKQEHQPVVYEREKATEEKAKSPDIRELDYIHLSCHGVLGDGFQGLVLSQIPGSSEDGYLTLNEIMNCEYHAKLVVLSACRTGKGKMERAEGVTGLTRAVMYAGTPAVVASLWDVDDNATKELMVRFYRHMLEEELDKHEALRQAKLDLIKSKKYASPAYWSAFVMYGE